MNKQHWPLLLGDAGWFSAIYWLAERGTFVSPNKAPVAVGMVLTTPHTFFIVPTGISTPTRAHVHGERIVVPK